MAKVIALPTLKAKPFGLLPFQDIGNALYGKMHAGVLEYADVSVALKVYACMHAANSLTASLSLRSFEASVVCERDGNVHAGRVRQTIEGFIRTLQILKSECALDSDIDAVRLGTTEPYYHFTTDPEIEPTSVTETTIIHFRATVAATKGLQKAAESQMAASLKNTHVFLV